MAETFTLFNALPTELRLLIWYTTLEPRIIPLQCEIRCCTYTPGTFLYNSFMQPTERSRSLDTPTAINDIRIHIAAKRNIAPAPALEICRESRQFAIKQGYRVWKLKDEFGNTRDVMWNARLDIVSFATPHRRSMPRFYGELFRRQFPVEVRRVQNIAVPLVCWEETNREKKELGDCWVEYTGLKKIVVALAHYRRNHGRLELNACELIQGMKSCLGKIPAGRDAQEKAPIVILIRKQEDILRAEDVEIHMGDSCHLVKECNCTVWPGTTRPV
ncbi:hypothetical protein VTL71DRAFT_3608 [Oculimacula yallundae]|uniref:2EXR domain-containing protein n=1 Tax=Oculimacula yallundae TaxID=86028 RepID=A0ABR4C7P2_9HELO